MSWPPATKYILIGVVPFLCDSARRQLSNFSVQYILLYKLFVTLHQFVSKLFVTTHQAVVQTLYSNASGFCPNSLWQCIWLLFKLFVTVHLVAVQNLCDSASGCCSNSLLQCIWLLFKLFVTVHLIVVQTLCDSAKGLFHGEGGISFLSLNISVWKAWFNFIFFNFFQVSVKGGFTHIY